MISNLDPILLHTLRLKLMSVLIHQKEIDFIDFQKMVGVSSGNLSLQVKNLKKAGYLDIQKSFKGNYPSTTLSITRSGRMALVGFFDKINSLRLGEQSTLQSVNNEHGNGN
jgi:hypothetical protein